VIVGREAAVEDVLRDFASAYEHRDLAAMGELFAHDGDVVFYGTQANLHWFGWDALEGSLKKQFAVVERASLRYHDLRVRLLGSDAACVAMLLDYDATISGAPVVARGIRVTGSLDRVAGRWRIVHMHWSIARPEVIVEH
jgi:uncharacterized protein (TIGR02246 family)